MDSSDNRGDRVSEQMYRRLMEWGADATVLVDSDGRLFEQNRRAESLLGYSTPTLRRLHLSELFRDQERERVEAWLEQLQPDRAGELCDTSVCRRDGSDLPVDMTGSLIEMESGLVLQVVLRDITERKAAQRQRSADTSFLDAVIRRAAEGLCVCHEVPEFPFVRFTVWNQRMLEITGYTMEEINRLGWYQSMYLDPEVQQRAIERMSRMRVGEDILGEEWTVARKDGTPRILRISTTIIQPLDDSVHVLAVMQDVTEQRRFEQEMIKAMRLESLGLLAGGIAHDFNNILSGILGNISLVKTAHGPDTMEHLMLSEAEAACDAATELTRQLLTFSKGGEPLKQEICLDGLLQECTIFALRGSSVRSTFELAEGLWAVEVDEGQIKQVIHNLVLNAKQAMPGGGRVCVRADNITVQEDDPRGLVSGPYIRVQIEDQGEGISEPELDLIFDPYWSTKPKGNGLGLSTSYSIIRRHGGLITVSSRVGRGSTFSFMLPALGRATVCSSPAVGPALQGKGRILVMDDSAIVRDTMDRMLRRLGYEVELAVEGEEMLAIYRRAQEGGKPFSAVFMDLTVPGGMGGKEAIEQLRELDPHARAIVISGYSNDPVMADYLNHGFCAMVTKPFDLAQLSQTLLTVLQG